MVEFDIYKSWPLDNLMLTFTIFYIFYNKLVLNETIDTTHE